MAESRRPTCLLYQDGILELTLPAEDPKQPDSSFREEGTPEVAMKALLSDHPLPGEFETALSARNVMMMVVTLPSTDPADIEGMVQLQSEDISPFPPERTRVSWEILDQAPPQSTVLLSLCAQKELDALQKQFGGKGSMPARVDVDVLGWLELLKSEKFLTPETDTLVLILHGESCHVLAWQHGVPRLIRSWMNARTFSSGTLKEELLMLQLSLESAYGKTELQHLDLWYDGELPEWAHEPPEGWEIHPHALHQLPSLGSGLVARGARGNVIDLAPPAWKEEKKQQENRKKVLKSLMGAGGAWLLLMVGFFGWAQYRQSGLRSLEKENAANQNAAERVQELSTRVRSLTQFTDRSSSALETLLLLASATPGSGSLIIDDYRYDKEDGIVFSGNTAGDVQPFYQFLERVAAGDLLRVKSYDLKESRQGFSFQVETTWTWVTDEIGEDTP